MVGRRRASVLKRIRLNLRDIGRRADFRASRCQKGPQRLRQGRRPGRSHLGDVVIAECRADQRQRALSFG